MKKKGESNIIMILLILGFLGVATGILNLQTLSIGGAPVTTAAVSGVSCPDTKATNLDVRVRNSINSSEDFNVGLPTSVVFRQLATGGVKEQTRGATTGATALTQTVDCGAKYDVFILPVAAISGAGVNSISLKGVQAEGRSVQKDIPAYQAGYPLCKITSSSWSNLTAEEPGKTNGFLNCGAFATAVTSAAETYGLGTSNTYHLQIMTNTTGTLGAFGSNDPELKTYACFDFNTGIYSLQNGVVIKGLTPLAAVPSGGPANDGFDKCYVISPIVSTDAMRDYEVSIFSDLANPGTSDDVSVRFYDEQWYIGADGLPKKGTVDDVASDVGLTNVGVQWAIA